MRQPAPGVPVTAPVCARLLADVRTARAGALAVICVLILLDRRRRCAAGGRACSLSRQAIREVPGDPVPLAVRAIVARLPGVGDRLADDAVQNAVFVLAAEPLEPLADNLQQHGAPLRPTEIG